MSRATRLAVHSWLGQPCFLAPCRRSRSSWRSCPSDKRGVCPTTGLAWRPWGFWARRRQRCTEVGRTPRMRATTVGDSPCSTASTARRRRRSSSAAVPLGLIHHYTQAQLQRLPFRGLESVSHRNGHDSRQADQSVVPAQPLVTRLHEKCFKDNTTSE